jgi:uncharacterized protein (DUF2235 family)
MKRLVVCCDGTWQKLSQPYPTNVVKTASCVLPRDGDGAAQIVFYDQGVGTDQSFAPRTASVFGGAFGQGLEENICEAYRFIIFNYEPGDDIFVFGFSRGAYTARSLCGLIDCVGILRRAECLRANEAFRFYVANRDGGQANALARFAAYTHDRASAPQPIAFLGVWDTVGARGIPDSLPGSRFFNRQYDFHSVSLTDSVRSARHAVAIDERRKAFPACVWDNVGAPNAPAAGAGDAAQPCQQLWFVGDHGNVGGGVEGDGLSNISLVWVLEGSSDAGLALDPVQVDYYARRRNCRMTFSNAILRDVFSPAQWVYFLLGGRDRDGPASVDGLHTSVRERWQQDQRYKSLRRLEP